MDISLLKSTIKDNNKIEEVLDAIGCKSIQFHTGADDDYYTCANKDGDNPSAITVYCNNSLKCINYTRDINPKKTDHDIIDLVMFNEKINFYEALKMLCDIAEIDYYGFENEDDLPESIKLTRLINGMCSDLDENEYEEVVKINPRDEIVLTYYRNTFNEMFKDDGISYETQYVFELGYDDESNAITIPIRDEIGNLVGVKARFLNKEMKQNKYMYLLRCPRGMILYNYFRAYKSILEAGYVIVVEAEKSAMQLFDMGIYNVVALSGSKVTAVQRQKLMNLNCKIVFALDKDITIDKLQTIANKFPYGIDVYAIIDSIGILDEKESPSDNKDKWKRLFKECMVKL